MTVEEHRRLWEKMGIRGSGQLDEETKKAFKELTSGLSATFLRASSIKEDLPKTDNIQSGQEKPLIKNV